MIKIPFNPNLLRPFLFQRLEYLQRARRIGHIGQRQGHPQQPALSIDGDMLLAPPGLLELVIHRLPPASGPKETQTTSATTKFLNCHLIGEHHSQP